MTADPNGHLTAQTTGDPTARANGHPADGPWWRGRAELGLCAGLLVLGALVIVDALRIPDNLSQRGPVGPEAVPLLVGGALAVVAVLLAVDVLRGGKGQAEGGEDIDLDAPADWRTVLMVAAAFLANVVLIEPLGFPISMAIMFWGSVYALGSRNLARDPLVAAGLSLITWFLFDQLLGVPLPGGPLMEVL
ncbi:tripartite tricarboxylate transporter TctB family protein [Spirillospora sp. NPDC048911]|uniref:tripartite tricarboxylate transporter TctB family protein n=1 Tax=Spirillospora sp. NPDC048911 TaxID=3364527 RepID=UPI003715C9A8